MSLAVHNQDPDAGFKKVSSTKSYEDYRAKFAFFELLKHNNYHFFYFHSWYKRYGNALIVTYIAKSVPDICMAINKLAWDYSKKPREQISYEPDDLSEIMQSPDYIDQLKDGLLGSNVLITYRKSFVKEAPIFAIGFDIYKTVDSIVRVKPGIYLPKNLQPKYLSKSSTTKKSIHDILGKSKALVELDEEMMQ